jgi:glycosidase
MEYKYPAWMADAVIYQIFPASFQDSNGDGIGDLNGIRQRLDYIQDLGFDTVWLCPIYESPFRDAGYDISDYCAIAPRYGSMDDFAALVDAIHVRGMRLILDFVPGHTSDEHPWFKASSRHEHNAFSDRYIWSPTTFCGPGEFTESGGDYIKGIGERDGNFLANFFAFQPALNYGYADARADQPWKLSTDHPAVKALRMEMHRILRFWLDKGVDGFRVDMASSLIKGEVGKALRVERIKFWREIREWCDRDYPEAALIAEWSNPSEAIETGLHLDFMIHFGEASAMKVLRGENRRTIINTGDHSYFDPSGRGELQHFFGELQGHLARIGNRGLLSVPTGNHDLPRYSVDRSEAELKCILSFLLTLPAVPTLYYGDEIGLRHLFDLPSKEGAYRRTGARTPMQWDDSPGAGFSEAPEPSFYLPLDPSADRPNASEQLSRKDSLLHHLRTMLQLRRKYPGLGLRGSLRQLSPADKPYPVVYERHLGRDIFRIAINALDRPTDFASEAFCSPPKLLFGEASLLLSGDNDASEIKIHLPANSSAIWHTHCT